MRVHWATTGSGCHRDVIYHEDFSDLANPNNTIKSTAKAGHTKLTADNMCSSPAKDRHFTLHTYSALLTSLRPGVQYTYNLPGSSDAPSFTAPPPTGPHTTATFVAYGDMGHPWKRKCPGAKITMQRVTEDARAGRAGLALHVGDLSYANGKPHHWDAFMDFIAPLARSTPYMVAVGNHEYDYYGGWQNDPSGARPYHPDWGNFGGDSGGECGVMTASRFHMPHLPHHPHSAAPSDPAAAPASGAPPPAPASGAPPPAPPPYNHTLPAPRAPFWYSFNYGPLHFVVLSTEHALEHGSPQYSWLVDDLAGVDRCVTPWVVLALHRPLYVVYPHKDNRIVGQHLRDQLEPLLRRFEVDATLSGHVHSYSRTCSVHGGRCVGRAAGGTMHFVVGSGGHVLSGASGSQEDWFEATLVEYGYVRFRAEGRRSLSAEFVRSEDGEVLDSVVLEARGAQMGGPLGELCQGAVGGGVAAT